MPRYRYDGATAAVFPSIVIQPEPGVFQTLEVSPGDVIDLDTDPQHPDFVAVKTPKASAPADPKE